MTRVLAAVDAIIIGSPPMRRSAYLAAHQDKLHLIPYGIPLARFHQRPADEELARVRGRYLALKRWRMTGRNSSSSGRLRYYKGLDSLIARPDAHFARLLVVVGTGPMEGDWQALAAQTGVADRIAWLGEVPDADLPALYHLADLFVLPASHPSEAFGLVQVEAMAAGLPVVCTELGTGTSYVNHDGETGRVVPPPRPHRPRRRRERPPCRSRHAARPGRRRPRPLRRVRPRAYDQSYVGALSTHCCARRIRITGPGVGQPGRLSFAPL